LLVSRDATGVNKPDFARSKRKIRMPEIEKQKKKSLWLTQYLFTFKESDKNYGYHIKEYAIRVLTQPIYNSCGFYPTKMNYEVALP
jgi:hypothetical protein